MDAAPAHRETPHSFSELLLSRGYAPGAVYAVMGQYIAPAEKEAALTVLRPIIGNYYMQFLALQLERYHFTLNRPLISADQLHLADNLIEGKHGNPNLDNADLVALLAEMGEALAEIHSNAQLTWKTLYDQLYTSPGDGSSVYGRDLLRALLHSDATHEGARMQPYHHSHAGHNFATLSMMQVIAATLSALTPVGLENVNRFGRPVEKGALEHARSLHTRYARLRAPKLVDFYNRNSHENIRTAIDAIFTNLHGQTDLSELHFQRLQLQRDYFNPGMYSPAWHRFLEDMDAALQLVATPYR